MGRGRYVLVVGHHAQRFAVIGAYGSHLEVIANVSSPFSGVGFTCFLFDPLPLQKAFCAAVIRHCFSPRTSQRIQLLFSSSRRAFHLPLTCIHRPHDTDIRICRASGNTPGCDLSSRPLGVAMHVPYAVAPPRPAGGQCRWGQRR